MTTSEEPLLERRFFQAPPATTLGQRCAKQSTSTLVSRSPPCMRTPKATAITPFRVLTTRGDRQRCWMQTYIANCNVLVVNEVAPPFALLLARSCSAEHVPAWRGVAWREATLFACCVAHHPDPQRKTEPKRPRTVHPQDHTKRKQRHHHPNHQHQHHRQQHQHHSVL